MLSNVRGEHTKQQAAQNVQHDGGVCITQLSPYLLVGVEVCSTEVLYVRHADDAGVEPALRQRLQYLADLLVLT